MREKKLSYSEKLKQHIQKLQEEVQKIQEEGKRKKMINFKALSSTWDEYFVLHKLILYCEYLSNQTFINSTQLPFQLENDKLMCAVLETLKKTDFDNPLIKAYWIIKQLYENIAIESVKAQALIQQVLEIGQTSVKLFSAEESTLLYSCLTNFCTRKINQGESIFRKTLLMIYQEMLHVQYEQYHKKNKKIPPGVFKNMVSNALKISDAQYFKNLQTKGLIPYSETGYKDVWEWIEKFIAHYQQFLSKKGKETYLPYCQALVAYQSEQINEAYQKLHLLKNKRGMFIPFNIKVLYLKVLFDISVKESNPKIRYDIEFDKALDSYKSLIKDEKRKEQLSDYHVVHHKKLNNLFYSLKQFYQKYETIGYKDDKIKFEAAKEKLIKKLEDFAHDKSWFLERIESIK